MITQVFPDEFHLNTLDQLLPAIARLNPHVNIKAIVIGLMDRLSAYAERESESESPEDRKKSEEEATIRLMEQLKISKEAKATKAKEAEDTEADHPNGDHPNGETAVEGAVKTIEAGSNHESEATLVANGESSNQRSRGIPEEVKLYEIFYGQVTHLVHAQRLLIQDTIALLVSLANLAL